MRPIIALFASLLFALPLMACESCSTPVVQKEPELGPEQIKAVAAAIVVQPSEEARTVMGMMANAAYYQRLGQSRQFNAWANGSAAMLGSGFGVSTDGKTTIIGTNKHVVVSGSVITITMGDQVGKLDGKVLYVSENRDLAFIEVPGAQPLLPLKDEYAEMDNVVAAGYPGIGMGRSYQVTTGTVSNRCFNGELLGVKSNGDCAIQHSASIDGGSSGGPLISLKGKAVIGVNTYLATENHNAYFSIPAKAVLEEAALMTRLRSGRTNAAVNRLSLQVACKRLIGEISAVQTDVSKMLPLIGEHFANAYGPGAIPYMGDSDQDKADALAADAFGALRYASAWMLAVHIKNSLGGVHVNEQCFGINPGDSVVSEDGRVRIKIATAAGYREMTWANERLTWKIVDFTFPQN